MLASASASGSRPLRRTNAITTSIASADSISVWICRPTRGSPGALVSSVVSSSGISGRPRHTDDAVRTPLADAVQRLTSCQWKSICSVALRNAVTDLAQQTSNHVDANGDTVSVRNGIKSLAQQSRQVLRDPIRGVRRPQHPAVDHPTVDAAESFVQRRVENRFVKPRAQVIGHTESLPHTSDDRRDLQQLVASNVPTPLRNG